ncbi:MAG: RluA family pseudouridine synthase [Pseudomonadota bacterium]
MRDTRTPPAYAPPPAEALKIICKTDQFAVIDKPSALLSVPGRGPDKAICAQSIVQDRLGEALTVHRLDMDTSGLMVFACTKAAQRALSMAFQDRQVDKTYNAIVSGVPQSESGRIDLPIARFSRQRPLRHVAEAGDADALPASTSWRLLEPLDGSARLELKPITGRSHQLRLHLAAIGHPILGDVFYGEAASAPRLLLHASMLCFPDPAAARQRCFDSSPGF